jgi:hypothetical protein
MTGMLESVSGIIEGRRWLEERLRHLQAALSTEITDDQREAVEAEIERLRGQLGSSHRRVRRWFIWGGRPPEH